MSADLRKTLKDLLKVQLDQGLLMSVYLDASPDAKGQRHHEAFLKKRFSELVKHFPPRSPLHGYLQADIGEINRYLNEELETRTKGVAIFISQGKKFFTALQTVLPFPNTVAVSRLPYIYPLVRMADDYGRYGAIVSDEKRARLFKVYLGQVEEEMVITTDVEAVSAKGYETKKGRLGHSDERYRRHLEGQIAKHAKAVLGQAVKFFGSKDVDCIILSAENGVLAAYQALIPSQFKGKLVTTSKLEVKAPGKKILDETLAIYQARENQASLAVAQEAVVLATGRGGRAVVGTEATLNALQSGQAETLVIGETYNDEGWKCGNCLQLGAGGQVKKCPFCSSDQVARDSDMKEELVELAIRQGAKVEFYHGASELKKYGGVGALLRSR